MKKLLEEDLVPNLVPESMLDPNDFRRDRLYTAQMEKLIKTHFEMLHTTFKLYKAKDKTKYFCIEHWMTFLESTQLLGSHTGLASELFVLEHPCWTGIEKGEAKLLFAWSQMTVIDELKKRQRAVSLLFFDFIEVTICNGVLYSIRFQGPGSTGRSNGTTQ